MIVEHRIGQYRVFFEAERFIFDEKNKEAWRDERLKLKDGMLLVSTDSGHFLAKFDLGREESEE